MELERRALYNALRMNWLIDPSSELESWQVEDYRVMSFKALFDRLKAKGITLDRVTFIAMAENHLTPESFTDELLVDSREDAKEQDQIYLLVFELWRRLVPEKPCLSVFCDELDYQIHLYDKGMSASVGAIQDALANLQVILDENADEGTDPLMIFESVSAGCANDIESFLYDFIAEQIDNQNHSYASDLLDGFSGYVKDVKWFDFLRARLMASTDVKEGNRMIRKIVQETIHENDLEFNLEVLSSMVEAGERDLFIKLVNETVKILTVEEDFADLLSCCADFYHRLDLDNVEQEIQQIIDMRSHEKPGKPIHPKDPQIAALLKVIV